MASYVEPMQRKSEPAVTMRDTTDATLPTAQPAASHSLQRALNDSPRLEPQRRLQRMLAEAPQTTGPSQRAAGVTISSEPASAPASSGAVVQGILIKVSTKHDNLTNQRRVSEVEFAERVPTIVSSGQGDHTVSEALLELTLERFCIGKTHAQIAAGLPMLLQHLDSEAVAKFLAENGKYETMTIGKIKELISAYQMAANSGTAYGEDLNGMLENIFEMFLRLWNKRAGSAYARKEGMTFGGGKEKEGKKEIIAVADQFESPAFDYDEDSSWKLRLARALAHMIDFNVTKGGLEEAARHVVTAIELVLQNIPEADFYYNDVMTVAVQVFAEGAKLSPQQEEALDQRVADLMRGKDEDYEDDTDEEKVDENLMHD